MKRLAVVFVLLLASALLCSQEKSNVPTDLQWEYLVISFGKTTFGVPEKMMAYKSLGLDNGNEATDLQKNIDILGRFGWDVIGIVGAVGGDQQIVLKRKYDKARSENEYGMIQSGKEIYLKDLQDIIQRALRLADEQNRSMINTTGKPSLIDYDEVDKQKTRKDLIQFLAETYKAKFDNLKIGAPKMLSIEYKTVFSDDVVVYVSLDLTKTFLIDNKGHRSSSVRDYLKNAAQKYKYRDSKMSSYSGISIKFEGYLTFNGDDVRIGSYTTSNAYSGGSWNDGY